MKRILSFLRSMRFGMILLGTIAVLSVIGTLVIQGQGAAFYEQAYSGLSDVILFCGFDHMYSTWYYAALFAALCLNLLLCSILRLGKIRRAKTALLERARKAKVLDGLDVKKVEVACRKLGFKPVEDGLYIRRTPGLYGSFITHLGMLLLVVAAACVFSLESKEEAYVLPGNTMMLADGCQVTVDAFSMENEAGQLDYISSITVAGKDGKRNAMTAKVNHPARFEDHTVYQQSYNFAGVLDVQTALDAPAEQVVLDNAAFISLDGVNGVHYMQVCGDYTLMKDGKVMPVQSMEMNNPAYVMAIMTQEGQMMDVKLPGETFEVGGVYYTFQNPMAYPGLTVKTQPTWVMPLLYTSFAVLMVGLYLCFFHVPSALCVAEGCVRVISGKDEADLLQQIRDKIEETEE